MKNYIELNKDELKRWNGEKGDKTHRLNYDLNSESLVFDVGGYKGEWAQSIFSKYGCTIHIFEPVKKYYSALSNRFKDNDKVFVHNYGLSNCNKEEEIFLSNDASSVFGGSGAKETIVMKSMIEFMRENEINEVDLIKINIEGGEYDLLEDVINNGEASKFKNIQVQYHRFVKDCVDRREKISKALKDTHDITYNFEFIWENWKRR